MNYGCKLGMHSSNIIAYADDIVILAPSMASLQILVDAAAFKSKKVMLNFNTEKSKYMVFKHRRQGNVGFCRILMNGSDLEQVESFRYLGFILTRDMSNSDDIARARQKFYSDFNCLLRKFYFADPSVKVFLFKQFCLQLYGSDLWFPNTKTLTALKQFGVGYHKAIKKILGLSYHESNHYVCQEASLLTFQHLVNKKKIDTALRVFVNPCTFIKKLNYFFIISSEFLRDVRDICLDIYEIEMLFEQDRDAVTSRIQFVQNHEDQMRRGLE